MCHALSNRKRQGWCGSLVPGTISSVLARPLCCRGNAALLLSEDALVCQSGLATLGPDSLSNQESHGLTQVLDDKSIYITQYFLINGCTSHMVFKKHLYQDEKLFDLQPTSKIERQLGVVFLGKMLMTPMKTCLTFFKVACRWALNACCKKSAPTISSFKSFSIKSSWIGDTMIPWVIPFAHLRQCQCCQRQTYFRTLYFHLCGLHCTEYFVHRWLP